VATPKRDAVPLFMLPENIDVLLEHTLEVETISFKRYDGSDTAEPGVILMIGASLEQKSAARALGFKFVKVEK
jgi:hypothetical protein